MEATATLSAFAHASGRIVGKGYPIRRSVLSLPKEASNNGVAGLVLASLKPRSVAPQSGTFRLPRLSRFGSTVPPHHERVPASLREDGE